MKIAKYIIFLIILLNQFIFTQNIDSLNRVLKNIITKYDVLGMSLLVVRNNDVVFSQGYGLSDYARQINVNSDSTLFRIASISKSVTGTAIIQLYEKGKLKITEDISRYLGYTVRNPNFPGDSITFIHLLTHTSGLQDGNWYDNFLSLSYGSNIPLIKDLFIPGSQSYTAQMWGNYKPGDRFEYCNFAFGMLGTLLEKISGERFDIYCKKYIFQPLGIKGSFNIQDIEDMNQLATIYRKSGSQWAPQTDNYSGIKPEPRDISKYNIGDNGLLFSPQGGLRISALDLSKFMRAHMGGGKFGNARILNDTTVALMHKVHWAGSGLGGFYKKKGLSIHITDDLIPGKTMLGHSGEAYGLLSDMYFDKDYTFGIIFIMNGGKSSGGSLFYGVEEEIIRSAYDILIKNSLSAPEMNYIPYNYKLDQNYPNPFNPSTEFTFSLPVKSKVKINIFNILGEFICNLLNVELEAGKYKSGWNGNDENGKPASSGLYFYSMNTPDKIIAKKMILIR